MSIRVSGIIHGKRIEFDSPPALPDGSPVIIQIEPRKLSLDEKKKLANELCGAWVDSDRPGGYGVFDLYATTRKKLQEGESVRS